MTEDEMVGWHLRQLVPGSALAAGAARLGLCAGSRAVVVVV